MTRRSRDPSASNTTDAAEQDQGPCPGGHLGTLHRSCVPPGVAVSISKAPKRAARCRRGDVSRRLHALRGHPGTHADLASLFSPVVEREKLETRSHATLAEILTPLSATYPEVHVRRYVVEGSPVEQLEKLSANARLLVVGSRGSEPVVGPRARLRVRETIARAHCPVAVIHPRTSSRPAISRAGDVPIQDAIRGEFR